MLYDNETGLYLFDQEVFDAPWYEDEEGYLYIMHPDGSWDSDAPHGPDVDRMPASAVKIPECLKRFHPLDSYYHA